MSGFIIFQAGDRRLDDLVSAPECTHKIGLCVEEEPADVIE